MRTYLTAQEAADRLGCGLRTIREACASGVLPSVRERTAYLIAVSDVDAYGRYRKEHGLRNLAAARRRNREAREASEAEGGEG